MKRLMGLILAVALVYVGFAASAYAAKDSPYILSKKEFKQRVKSISLSPLDFPPAFELSHEMRGMIEAEATQRLAKKKLETVGIAPYEELRNTFAQRIGGLTNAEGVLDPRRKAVVWDHAKREMRYKYPVDAFAEISLRPVSAVFTDDRAEWDGVKQKVKHSGDGFALFGGKNYQGTIAAISFQLAIFDAADELLFVNRGGIEVMQERQGAKLVVLPAEGLLKDAKKIKKAVQLAFKQL